MVTCFRSYVMRFGAACGALFVAHLFAVVHCFSLLLAAFAVSFAVMSAMPIGILVGPGYMDQQVRAICWLLTPLALFELG